MWLTREGFDFAKLQTTENIRSKLDLPRMKKGGLDAVFFAVFVGQKERNAEGNTEALSKANRILDSISGMLDKLDEDLVLARTPEEFKRAERMKKKVIFLGMENGYPVGNDLSLLDTFYNKGIRYITLCHSYNNDICDSSSDSAEHRGLSSFGESVLERMNELGIMIDVSHASDETFYQVVEQSKAPIIASHSCARAICDHPRNMSDDMLLQLKENGGVIQMCILSRYVKASVSNPQRDSAKYAVQLKHGDYYSLDEQGQKAFLEDWFQVDIDFPPILADVSDVVDHIDHIVEIAGIDHVGIGTDFDGGGGVDGCYDVSELGNITLELVKRGYTSREIKKIWGANLLRVMKEVEAVSS